MWPFRRRRRLSLDMTTIAIDAVYAHVRITRGDGAVEEGAVRVDIHGNIEVNRPAWLPEQLLLKDMTHTLTSCAAIVRRKAGP